jgi:SAM-dependent methyltransferase
MDDKKIKKIVREGYARIVKNKSTCCGSVDVCCGNSTNPDDISVALGYSKKQLKSVPDESNLGLGCGNPTAIASLKEGEIVLDLGSGAGFDCFLAANRVGVKGKVIGIDMTPEMIEKAELNVKKNGYSNVEFRLGEIERLPVESNFVDVVISNCVINLSPNKKQVFNETYRVLKPGGRLVVSDIVLLKDLPDYIKDSVEAYVGCVSGAILKDEYIKLIEEAGFQDIVIADETSFSIDLMINDPAAQAIIKKTEIPDEALKSIGGYIVSIKLTANKIKRS